MSSEGVTSAIKQALAKRAKGYCEYCRCPGRFATENFTVEHIKPRKDGGKTTLDNLAWACFGCNSYKHSRTSYRDPETGKEVALFNPRLDSWTEHFAWSDDLTHAIGKTPCGRATIEALRLNRTGVVNLRGLLVITGLHPPPEF